MLAAALFIAGVSVTKVSAEVTTKWDPSNAYGTTWTAATNTLSWNKDWANVLYTGFAPKSNGNSTPVDLSKYDKIHYNITSLSGTASDANGAYIELKVRSTGKGDINLKLYEGEHDIVFADYAATIDFSKILELTVSATYEEGAEDGTPGSAVIPEMYLYTDKWIIQHQQQTVSAYALGSALELSSVVSNNSLVSIVGGNNTILYGKAVDGSEWGSNQIKELALNDAMALIAGDDNTSYQFRIIDATDEVTSLPTGVTKLYRIKAFKKDGTSPFTGPGWNGGNSFYLQEISWTYNVADGTSTSDASFFSITAVAGKDNTYAISAYKKDGSAGYKQTIYNRSEWTFNVISETQQQSNVDVWVELPNLTFDTYGFATTGNESLTATGGLSYNSLTGVLTSDGTAGKLTLEFANSVNLGDLNTFDVKRTGNSDIVNRLKFYDEAGDLINTWNNAKWSNSGLDYNATNAFKTHNPVKKLVWEADANAENNGLTLTISAIEWQLKTISAMKGTDITTLPYNLWDADGDNDANVVNSATPDKKFNVLTGDVIYGMQNIGDSKNYVDLTNYKKLIVRGYGTIRLFYNWHQSTGEGDQEFKPIDVSSFVNSTTTVKTMEIDIPAYMKEKGMSHFHLIGVKGSGNCFVESISVVVGTENYDYAISGKGGLILPSATEALADTKATVIDAKGMTNDTQFKETLTTANPNCLIITDNADKLKNSQNVIVNGTCANLVLTDRHPFKAPADFTATSATYTTTINKEAKAGTLILPFAATIPTGVKAYTLTYASGDAVTATEQTGTIPASVPVLLNGSGEVTFTGSGTVTNVPTANIASNLVGVYEETTVPQGSYVLQDGEDGVGFYKVTSNDIKANPFRAYLKASGAGAAKVRVIYEAEDATAITSLEAQDVVNETIYNLNGMRISHPTKGIYIKNGKKFIVK